MKLEVGMYVRTKIVGIQKFVSKDNEHYYFGSNKNDIVLCCLKSEFQRFLQNYSSNLIDLIEIGDYVNGELVEDITGEYLRVNGQSHNKHYFSKQIKSIVTKEQFEQMSYKVGE